VPPKVNAIAYRRRTTQFAHGLTRTHAAAALLNIRGAISSPITGTALPSTIWSIHRTFSRPYRVRKTWSWL
jgi:hypothetical protein